MKISEHVYMLEVGTVYPSLLFDGKELVLVDAAHPLEFELLEAAIVKEGFSVAEITKIILTHQDIDHIGCIKECLEVNPNIQVYAHVEEVDYINGNKTPIKLQNLKNIYDSMDEKGQEIYHKLDAGFSNRRIQIDHQLIDQEVMPICGNIEVLHTPGHTPGHICLFIRDDKVLITGDALNVKENKVVGPNPAYTQNMDLALQSLEQLVNLPINYLILYHGGLIEENISKQIKLVIQKR